MFSAAALRLLRRVLGAATPEAGSHTGEPTVLDGNTAVAVTEAGVSSTAILGGSFPADLTDLLSGSARPRAPINLAGLPIEGLASGDPRGILSAAMGLALSGNRACVFLSAADLAIGRDLLSMAAGRRLPLVLHLGNRAFGGQATTLGSGHEALHLAADSGCLVLTAVSVQEAVDFTLLARRVAEQALTSVVVSLDGECTALAMQDVRLLPTALVEEFLGRPGDQVPTPSASQQLLFGATRRRVPRWHNPDRPVLLGGLQSPEVWGMGHAAGRAYLDPFLTEALDQAFEVFATLTGRHHRRVSAHRVDDARLILVAQGAAVEVAEAVADHLRGQHRTRVGVIGVRCLSPFPGAEISQFLGRAVRVCVLERADTPLAEDPPLLRELRAALDRSAENARYGEQAHLGYRPLSEKQRPRLHAAIFGLGGESLRGVDLVALCRELETLEQPRVYLGMRFLPDASAYPKRQVLLDRLRRSYPDITALGLRASGPGVDLRPGGALTVTIHRLSGDPGSGLAAALATLIHRVAGGGLRCRSTLSSDAWGAPCKDRVTAAGEGLRDPGDEAPEDLVVINDDALLPRSEIGSNLAPEGRLLIHSALPDEVIWARLPQTIRKVLKDGGAQLYRLAPSPDTPSLDDYLVGAVSALLLDSGLLDSTRRRLVAGHGEALQRDVADVQRHLAVFETGLDAARRIETAGLALQPAYTPTAEDDEAPALVRSVGSLDDTYDSLPRFWDQIGVLYNNGDSDELAPDPYLAVGAVPPRTAGFHDHSALRRQLPSLDPALCTGCGKCWTACPDSAINALALSPASLIDAGIRRTRQDGLRPLASKLAAAMTRLCRDPAARKPTAAELLGEAYAGLKDKLPFPPQQKQSIQTGMDHMITDLGSLPLATTGPFFDEPEAVARGSGELLALSIDPVACKACGLCVRACEPRALTLVRQGSAILDEMRQIREVWEGMPDTEPATIERLITHPALGTSAALLLDRNAARMIAGGDGAEPGSGAKLALRLVLATFEARQAPRFREFEKQVKASRDRILRLIRDVLAGALPADDMEALSRGLEGIDSRQAELGAFLGEAEQAMTSAVDTTRLRRLVDLAKALTDLAWRLAQGRQGLGRAHTGLVLSATGPAGWTVAFPHNPFAGPVAWDASGDGAMLAAGLLEGQLRQATEGLILMRKAAVELDRPEEAGRLWSDLERLRWRALTDDERALCPALLLAGHTGLLGGRGLGQLLQMLGSDLPMRVLLLADLDLGLAGPGGDDTEGATIDAPGIDLGLLAMAQRDTCIAQTSLGASQHLTESVEMALAARGPAVLHIHAPSPARHGFATDLTLQRARKAVDARAFPLFRYDPQAAGVFGSRLSLDGNPAPREAWSGSSEDGAYTLAHWALGEDRFAHLFEPLAEDAPDPLPLADFLALPEQERRNKTPFVEQAVNGDQLRRLCVSARLVRGCSQRLQDWRMLQELAGLVTPFTERVRQEAEQQVAEARRAQLAQQQQDCEQRVAGLKQEIQQQNREAVRERLMQLAGYQRPPDPPAESRG